MESQKQACLTLKADHFGSVVQVERFVLRHGKLAFWLECLDSSVLLLVLPE